jgi:hypothetical protein
MKVLYTELKMCDRYIGEIYHINLCKPGFIMKQYCWK